MKKVIFTIFITTMILGVTQICSAKGGSASYKIKVNIPAIVGLNVPEEALTPEIKQQDSTYASETFTEEVTRHGKTVVYKTTVLK